MDTPGEMHPRCIPGFILVRVCVARGYMPCVHAGTRRTDVPHRRVSRARNVLTRLGFSNRPDLKPVYGKPLNLVVKYTI